MSAHKMFAGLICFLVIFGFAGRSSGFETTDMRLNTNPAGSAIAAYAQVASDSSGHVYVVWQDNREGPEGAGYDIYFNRSDDYGAHWLENDIKINHTPMGEPFGIGINPQIACDENGNVYIVWTDWRNNESNIYFNHSADYGVTWRTGDIRVNTIGPPDIFTAEHPKIACDEFGYVYVAWRDRITYASGPYDIYFNSSSDHGETWQSADKRLDSDIPCAGNSNPPEIICDSGAHVYVAWEDYRSGKTDIYFNHSSDHGINWQENDVRLDTDTHGVNYSFSPKIACDANGHVYVAWSDERIGKVYYNYSSDYADTWQPVDMSIHPVAPAPANDPYISCDSNGNVYIAWIDIRNGGYQHVYFNHSADHGVSWQAADIRIDSDGSNSSCFYPQIKSDSGGRVYVAWTGAGSTGQHVYFNYSLDYGRLWHTAFRVSSNINTIMWQKIYRRRNMGFKVE